MKGSFHGFSIQERIGAGGMSTVYKGVHSTLNYPVAIKLLHVELSENADFIARFEREARTAASIRSGNIASVIDFGVSDDRYFIVMEYVDGRNFHDLMDEMAAGPSQNHALPVEVVLALVESVAYGLKAAHDCGVVHRDIKPRNLMLRSDGEVKIVDFGLARDVKDIGDHTATLPGTVLGTVAYMSPEQARGEKPLGPQTDIFSLGITCYEMLTGEKPFKGDSLSEIQSRIIRSAAPRLSRKSCPLLTSDIIEFASRMLAHNVEKRFQSMDQVLRAIEVCWDSFEIKGFADHRRAHLARFAADPLTFAQELRQKDVKAYLTRGTNFESMGVEKFGNAIDAFENVLSLDPENRQAAAARARLKKKLAESGIVAAMDSGPDGDRTLPLTVPELPPPRKPLITSLSAAMSKVRAVLEKVWTSSIKVWASIKSTAPRTRYLTAAIAVIMTAIGAVIIGKPGGPSTATSLPEFYPGSGCYSDTQYVRITCATAGAKIQFTNDGVDPTAASPEYRNAIVVPATVTLKAFATADDHHPSPVAIAEYAIEPALPMPTFDPPPGSFTSPPSVAVTCGVSGATIRYTLDGTNPADTSERYVGPIRISSTKTLKAMAQKSGYSQSAVESGLYEVTLIPPDAQVRFGLPARYHVVLDGNSLGSKGPGEVILSVSPGAQHTLTIRDEATFAKLRKPIPRIASGGIHDLGPLEFALGTLDVVGATGMSFIIDKRLMNTVQGESRNIQIGEGDHKVTFELSGYKATNAAIIVNGDVQLLTAAAGANQYSFSIRGGAHHTITCEFIATGE